MYHAYPCMSISGGFIPSTPRLRRSTWRKDDLEVHTRRRVRYMRTSYVSACAYVGKYMPMPAGRTMSPEAKYVCIRTCVHACASVRMRGPEPFPRHGSTKPSASEWNEVLAGWTRLPGGGGEQSGLMRTGACPPSREPPQAGACTPGSGPPPGGGCAGGRRRAAM